MKRREILAALRYLVLRVPPGVTITHFRHAGSNGPRTSDNPVALIWSARAAGHWGKDGKWGARALQIRRH
jgi:hypothetical protein